MKRVHPEGALKMHVGLVLASSVSSGGSLSEPPNLFADGSNKLILENYYIIRPRRELVGLRLCHQQ